MLESDLAALKRKDLQVLAKKNGLKANKKSHELISELLAIITSEATTETEITREENTPSPDKENIASDSAVVPRSDVVVGSIVHFIEAGSAQEGTIKRINKNSFRIKLTNGTEVTIPKAEILSNTPADDSNSVFKEASSVEVLDSHCVVDSLAHEHSEPSVSDQKSDDIAEQSRTSSVTKNKKKKKSIGKKKNKQSLPSGEITVSPIKKKISSTTQQKESPEKTEPSSSPQCEETILPEHESEILTDPVVEIEVEVDNVAALEEEKLMIDEELNLPKKKKKSSTNKKKMSPKQKNITIATEESVAPPVTTKSVATPGKQVKPPSIIPKTTAAMRARDNAISKKKQRMSELMTPQTPQGSEKTKIQKTIAHSTSKVPSVRCTIDSSIMEKINESSRRFSSSWSNQKPRKSLSRFVDKSSGEMKSRPVANVASVAAVAASVRQEKVVAKPNTVTISSQPSAKGHPQLSSTKKTASQNKSNGLNALNKAVSSITTTPATGSQVEVRTNTKPSLAAPAKHPVRSASVTTTFRPTKQHMNNKVRGMSQQHAPKARSSSAAPTRPVAHRPHTGNKKTLNTNTVSSKPASSVPKDGVTSKPNPAHFLKRSSSAGPKRAVSNKNIQNTNTISAAATVVANITKTKTRPAIVSVSHNKTRATGSENENNLNKPFKARPVPNFSKMHKHMFHVDKSVINMVKEVSAYGV